MDPIRAVAEAIDHTLLAPAASRDDIRRLCLEAAAERFAAVCVNPLWVAEAAGRLEGTGIPVASVVGFPLGATPAGIKVAEAERALEAGARELDMVLAVGLLKGGEDAAVEADVAAVAAAAHAQGALLKVILETCLLSEPEKERAARLAIGGGADFLKTSTGFGGGGATVEDVALLRRLAPSDVRVKASGGIRTFAQARAMLAAGASRLGVSAGISIMEEARRWVASH